jgi:hypothetical protein
MNFVIVSVLLVIGFTAVKFPVARSNVRVTAASRAGLPVM